MKPGLSLPEGRGAGIETLTLGHRLDKEPWDFEACRKFLKPFFQNVREGQQVIALTFEHAADRTDAMRASRLAPAEFLDDEVEQPATGIRVRPRQRQNVPAHPIGEGT